MIHLIMKTTRTKDIIVGSGFISAGRYGGGSAESKSRMLTHMETDGISDTIVRMSASDGKTMLVEYLTYKNFENVYNPDMNGKDELEARYALVDLETGTVYKDESYRE